MESGHCGRRHHRRWLSQQLEVVFSCLWDEAMPPPNSRAVCVGIHHFVSKTLSDKSFVACLRQVVWEPLNRNWFLVNQCPCHHVASGFHPEFVQIRSCIHFRHTCDILHVHYSILQYLAYYIQHTIWASDILYICSPHFFCVHTFHVASGVHCLGHGSLEILMLTARDRQTFACNAQMC